MADERPFSGLRVFDATQGVAGPHGTMLLALHGADVVKMEPIEGDWGRFIGRTYNDLCAHAIAFNRAKRSIAIDLKSDEGRAIAQKLAFEADIVVESFRPGVMEKFGLGYEHIKAHKPDVIYCSVSGFGQEGPNRDKKTSDTIMQAFSGLMTVNRDGQGVPRRIGMIPIDVMTGLYSFQAISAAVLARFRFGRGAHIDCSMLQAVSAFQSAKIIEHVLEGDEPQVLFAPLGTMPTADGYINVSGVKEEHYVGICNALERPDLIEDPRFKDRKERLERADEINAIAAEEFKKRPTAEWVERLSAANIMNAPVYGFGELLADPHVAAVNGIANIDHAGVGEIPIANIPGLPDIKAGNANAKTPHIGEHSRNILSEAGYGKDVIDDLIATKAIGAVG